MSHDETQKLIKKYPASTQIAMETRSICAFCDFSPHVGGEGQKDLEDGRNVPLGGDDSVSDVHPARSSLFVSFRAGRDRSCSISWCKLRRAVNHQANLINAIVNVLITTIARRHLLPRRWHRRPLKIIAPISNQFASSSLISLESKIDFL